MAKQIMFSRKYHYKNSQIVGTTKSSPRTFITSKAIVF